MNKQEIQNHIQELESEMYSPTFWQDENWCRFCYGKIIVLDILYI